MLLEIWSRATHELTTVWGSVKLASTVFHLCLSSKPFPLAPCCLGLDLYQHLKHSSSDQIP